MKKVMMAILFSSIITIGSTVFAGDCATCGTNVEKPVITCPTCGTPMSIVKDDILDF